MSILIQLQPKKIIKAQELRTRFEMRLQTIFRDIRTLQASGIPIYNEKTELSYSFMENYRSLLVVFTTEADRCIAADKLMQKFTEAKLGNHFTLAINAVQLLEVFY